jgi:hypothetical protein
VGGPFGKELLGKQRRWKYDTNMDIKEILAGKVPVEPDPKYKETS